MFLLDKWFGFWNEADWVAGPATLAFFIPVIRRHRR